MTGEGAEGASAGAGVETEAVAEEGGASEGAAAGTEAVGEVEEVAEGVAAAVAPREVRR